MANPWQEYWCDCSVPFSDAREWQRKKVASHKLLTLLVVQDSAAPGQIDDSLVIEHLILFFLYRSCDHYS